VLNAKRDLNVTEIKQVVRSSLHDIPDARVNLLGDWGTSDVQTILTARTARCWNARRPGGARDARPHHRRRSASPPARPAVPRSSSGPKADEAARLGVSAADIAAIARVATVGDIDANVAKMTQGERRIPIRVRLPAETAPTWKPWGPAHPHGQRRHDPIGHRRRPLFQAGPAKIDRFGRKRQLTIEADLNNGAQLGQAMKPRSATCRP
jgi:HAE1 family hydrophobic/amphiphilic exporter-1